MTFVGLLETVWCIDVCAQTSALCFSNTLEHALHQCERTLVPRNPVVQSRGVVLAFGLLVVVEIPLVGLDQCLLVRVVGPPAERLQLLDRDVRILVGGLVDPRVQRREVQLFEDTEREHGERRGRPDRALTGARIIDRGLEVLLHRAELVRADVEDGVHVRFVPGEHELHRADEIVDVHELILVVAPAHHRDVRARFDPVEKDLKDAETLGTDERLRAKYGHTLAHPAEVRTDFLGLDLRLAVRPDAIERRLLGDRVRIVGSVDRGRGHVDNAVDGLLLCGPEDVSRAVDGGLADAPVVPQRERSGGVNHRVRANRCDRLADAFLVADVAFDVLDALDLVLVFERLEVERGHVPAALFEVLAGVESQKARTAGDHHRPWLREPLVAFGGR